MVMIPALELVGVLGVRDPAVVAHLVADEEEDHQASGHADGEAEDVDERIGAVLRQSADADGQIIAPHLDLSSSWARPGALLLASLRRRGGARSGSCRRAC